MISFLLLCMLGAVLYGIFALTVVRSIRGKNTQEISVQYSFPQKLYDMHLLRSEYSVEFSSKDKQ